MQNLYGKALSLLWSTNWDHVVETPEVISYVKNIVLAVDLFSSYVGGANFALT